jgi:hypothetical protein
MLGTIVCMVYYYIMRYTKQTKEGTMKEKDRIEKRLAKMGLDITIAPATSWIGSLNAAMSWCGGERDKAAKMWAYSYYDKGYKAIVEPRKAYSTLKELEQAAIQHRQETTCFDEVYDAR